MPQLPTLRPSKSLVADKETVALLGAFCFFLSTIEYMIPKPLPFMRIGFANLPIMLALDVLSVQSFFLLVALKVVGQGLVTGTLFSYIFLFSLVGSFGSATLMLLTRRGLGASRISFVGVGTVGALVSNLSQVLMARVFIFGESAKYVAPPFLAVGVITGIALGLFCESFAARSVWYRDRLR